MNVDVFGHYLHKKPKIDDTVFINKCPLNVLSDGNLDADNKIIKNLHTPVDFNDCVTKSYVDNSIKAYTNKITTVNDLITTLITRITHLENHIGNSKTSKNEQNRRDKRNT